MDTSQSQSLVFLCILLNQLIKTYFLNRGHLLSLTALFSHLYTTLHVARSVRPSVHPLVHWSVHYIPELYTFWVFKG